MNKALLLFIFCANLLYAINITITQTDALSKPTKGEIDAIKAIYINNNIGIDTNKAKELITENRILAKEYLRSHEMPEVFKENILLSAEKQLADKMVALIQKDIKIDEEVLNSYYIAHKKDFIHAEIVDICIIQFDSFKEASTFYFQNQNDFKNIQQHCLDDNSTTRKTLAIDSLHQSLKEQILFSDKEELLLTPQFFKDHYSLVYSRVVEYPGYTPFEKVKDEIKYILHQQTFNKRKQEILKHAK
jgi:hypothetical protein